MNLYHERAELLKMLAHPVRLQILDALRQDEECVCHLSALLQKPQPYVSQQLAVLRNAGLIADRREGINIFYRLADEQVARQIEAALGPSPERDLRSPDHQPAAGEGGGSLPRRMAMPGCQCPKCRGAR